MVTLLIIASWLWIKIKYQEIVGSKFYVSEKIQKQQKPEKNELKAEKQKTEIIIRILFLGPCDPRSRPLHRTDMKG